MAFYTVLTDQIKSIPKLEGVLFNVKNKGLLRALGLHHAIAGVVFIGLGMLIGPYYAVALAISVYYADKELTEANRRSPRNIELFDWLTPTIVSVALAFMATNIIN